MKILVFAFNSGDTNVFLPHHYPENCVVYTGTHDNDTVVGWYQRIGEDERNFALSYLGTSGDDISWDLIKAAWGSRAVFALAPLQDLLSLDNEARMNYPGSAEGNWGWRFAESDLSEDIMDKLVQVNRHYQRTTK